MRATTAIHKSGFSYEQVEILSQARREPKWLQDWRREAWKAFENLPLPSSRYIQVRGLDLNAIEPVTEKPANKAGLPDSLRVYMKETGDQAGTLIFVDGKLAQCSLLTTLKNKGVLFMDMGQAIEEHPDLVKRLFEKYERPADQIDALQRALFNSGPFIHVPKGVIVGQPLKIIYLLTRPGLGALHQGLISADMESAMSIVEEFYSPDEMQNELALQAYGARIKVERGAQVHYAAVQNFGQEVFNFTRRWAEVGQDAKLRWTLGWLGGRTTFSHIENYLSGPGSEVSDVEIFFTGGRQHFDLTSNLRHQKPHTKGEVTVKGVLKDKSEAAYWGRIQIYPGAQHANAFQSARSLILENGPRSNAIPSLEIEANDVRCTHAASASPIDEEQIFYLQSRGFTIEQARKAIVEGFFEPTIEGIPLPEVQDRLRDLVDQKWQGAI